MQYIITNTQPASLQPNTVYFIINNNQNNYRLIETNNNGATVIDQSNYLNYIRTSTNDYTNQFYDRYNGLIIPLIVNPNNIFTDAALIIHRTFSKKYPIGAILLFTDPIQYNNNIDLAINYLLKENILVFAGINVENRNLQDILADIDMIANTYKQIRGVYFNNINRFINNNNYLHANILTGYAFYRKFELISIGIDDMIVDDQNLLNIISDLYVYNLQWPTFSYNDFYNTLLKNRLVAIIRNKPELNYSDIENYFNYVKFCYFTDLSSFDDFPTYFPTLIYLLDKYNFSSVIQSVITELNITDYFNIDETTSYILYGKESQTNTLFKFNKNFIYLIPFEVNTDTYLRRLSVYKLFDRINNGNITIGIYNSNYNNNPTNMLYGAQLNINQPFGEVSTYDDLNLLLKANKIYYFAITANNDLLVKGLSPNNINCLFGIYNKTNKPLTGFILPTRDNMLPDVINVQDLRPYFETVPAIYANISQT